MYDLVVGVTLNSSSLTHLSDKTRNSIGMARLAEPVGRVSGQA